MGGYGVLYGEIRVSSIPESSRGLVGDTCLDNDGDAMGRAANTASLTFSIHLVGSVRQEMLRRDLNHYVRVSIMFLDLGKVRLEQPAARDMALAKETLPALDVGRQYVNSRRRAHVQEEKRCCNAEGS